MQIHDEADLVSFRVDALNRFITNHEYLENITSKFIHSSRLIPPSLYPTVPQRDCPVTDLKHDDVYFGDAKMMQKKVSQLKQHMSTIGYNAYLPHKETKVQKKMTDKLTKSFNESSMDILEKQLNSILEEYKSEFNKTYSSLSVKKYSVDSSKFPDVKIEVAPKNYNPRLINTFVNIGENQTTNNGMDNNMENNYENGMFMDYENTGSNGFSNGSLNLTMGNSEMNSDINDNIPSGLSSHVTNLPTASQTNQSSKVNLSEGVNFEGDVDMNSLFKDGDGLDPNSGVVDDMGDLINFDNDSENEIIGSGTFDQDFLNM